MVTIILNELILQLEQIKSCSTLMPFLIALIIYYILPYIQFSWSGKS